MFDWSYRGQGRAASLRPKDKPESNHTAQTCRVDGKKDWPDETVHIGPIPNGNPKRPATSTHPQNSTDKELKRIGDELEKIRHLMERLLL